MVLSDTCLLCTLPSGNKAVYAVQPQHLNLQHWGATLNAVAIERGKQVAHEKGGQWFKPGGWEEITDLRTIALLERCPDA
ncbi:MAG: hypothetical protein EBS68_16630 [Rhodobacteraceae bacterium]|jgi:hypothetical protein|nr:hypothetical protein [Paracoccaceae bacterium]